jgi:hypothetical protein
MQHTWKELYTGLWCENMRGKNNGKHRRRRKDNIKSGFQEVRQEY